MTNDEAPSAQHSVLIAIDVGNTRAKWGLFVDGQLADAASLPLGDSAAYDAQVRAWRSAFPAGPAPANSSSSFVLVPRPGVPGRFTKDEGRERGTRTSHSLLAAAWAVASVNLSGSQSLLDWLRDRGVAEPVLLRDHRLLPLRVEVEEPGAVGIDRLLNAVAANQRRPAGRPAVIVDCGSAITVDAVSASGSFLGGAIAPGLSLSARGLHEFTYALPLVAVSQPPEPLGKCTAGAMRSGLFWGTIGLVKELVSRIAAQLGGTPALYFTGGDAPLVASHVDPHAELVPELTLHGICIAAEHVRRRS
jgi:type III pantothenate kinase